MTVLRSMHKMSATDFATAVPNAAELFQVMNAEIHPNDPPITVNICVLTP